jgi:anti-sigma factor RsiW
VDCKTFQGLISAAVDLQLTDGELIAFREHAHLCSPCRFEYDAELATKAFIRQRARHVPTPDHVARRIAVQLGQQRSETRSEFLLEFLQKPFVKPAIGFALAFVAVLFLLNDRTTDSTLSQASFASNDVVVQSLLNYGAVLAGKIKPQSAEPAQLQTMFSGITDYAVHMPKMKDCKLLGGLQNEFAGSKLAHLVYQHDTDIVYVYQTCLATVMKGEKLSLSAEAKSDLERTGWFIQPQPDGCTVVLWKKGRTLCAAVARMSKDDLIACLTSGEPRW